MRYSEKGCKCDFFVIWFEVRKSDCTKIQLDDTGSIWFTIANKAAEFFFSIDRIEYLFSVRLLVWLVLHINCTSFYFVCVCCLHCVQIFYWGPLKNCGDHINIIIGAEFRIHEASCVQATIIAKKQQQAAILHFSRLWQWNWLSNEPWSNNNNNNSSSNNEMQTKHSTTQQKSTAAQATKYNHIQTNMFTEQSFEKLNWIYLSMCGKKSIHVCIYTNLQM